MLRPWQQEDVDTLHALWALPDVRRFLWDDVVITLDIAAKAVESHLDTTGRLNVGFWAIEMSEEPLAGFCGFRPIDEGSEIELLYGLRREHWGKGVATEACAAALEYFWRATRYERVYARTDVGNDRSVQVMERLGMAHELTTDSLITYVQLRPGCHGSEVVTNTA